MFPILYVNYAEAIWPDARSTVYHIWNPEWKTVRDSLLDLAAVKFIVAKDPLAAVPSGLMQVYSDGDVTIYRSTEALARVRFVPDVITAPAGFSPSALKGMTEQLKSAVVLEDYVGTGPRPACSAAQVASVEYLEDRISQIRIRVTAPCRGFVVLADLFYPGWQATTDGRDTPIYKANYAFRAVESRRRYPRGGIRLLADVAADRDPDRNPYGRGPDRLFRFTGVRKLRARSPGPAVIA